MFATNSRPDNPWKPAFRRERLLSLWHGLWRFFGPNRAISGLLCWPMRLHCCQDRTPNLESGGQRAQAFSTRADSLWS